MVFVYTAMGVLCVEHANVLKLCYIELLSGDSSFRLCSLVIVTLIQFKGGQVTGEKKLNFPLNF